MAAKKEQKYGEDEEGTKKDDLEETREYLRQCIDEESDQRKLMEDDLRFAALDQWPSEIRKERENDVENGPRPCLTIDKLNQYIVQVVNDMRQGKPGINVRPQDDNADVETAKILKGLVRNIEDQSSADIAYSMAGENACKIGLGYFRITTEFVDASWDQELFIRPIPNTFSVYLSKHTMPDGSDAQRGYIAEAMPLDTFKKMYPKAKYGKGNFDGLDTPSVGYWRTEETITVLEEFCFKETAYELLFLADGTTIAAEDYARWPAQGGQKPEIQDRRQATKKQLKWRKCTGCEVLEERDLPGKYIPIVEVIGREAWVDGRRMLWGLVRPAKDSLRMYNYWASTLVEKFGLAPKTPFIVAKGQLEGLEDRWKNANRKNYSYLEYNPVNTDSGNALPAPARQGPTPMEAAYFHQMQVIEHDVQTSLGMFKSAVGESESQQSGRAILALQRESDTGTYHFGANLGIAIRHAGRIIVDLIPHYYDTKRIVRILGEDGEFQSVQLDPEQQQAMTETQDMHGGIQRIYNPGIGKYDVSITVGPSYNTKRMEDQAIFVEMAKGAADPGSAAVLRYLVMRNSDSPGAQEASKLLKALLPPPILQAISSKQPMSPEAMAQIQQMQQQMQGLQEGAQKLQQENVQLKAGVAKAQIQAQTDERIAGMEMQAEQRLEAMRTQFEARDAEMQRRLEAAEAQRNAEFERWKALLEARTDIGVAQIQAHTQKQVAQQRTQPAQ